MKYTTAHWCISKLKSIQKNTDSIKIDEIKNMKRKDNKSVTHQKKSVHMHCYVQQIIVKHSLIVRCDAHEWRIVPLLACTDYRPYCYYLCVHTILHVCLHKPHTFWVVRVWKSYTVMQGLCTYSPQYSVDPFLQMVVSWYKNNDKPLYLLSVADFVLLYIT